METERYVCVDVETNGLSPARGDRVIEVGAVLVEDGRFVAEFGTLINAGCTVPWVVERVHGISSGMLRFQPKPQEVWPMFLEFIADAPLVAHNASFDMSFIRHELGRLGLGLPNRSICTVKLSRRLYPRLPSHKLEAVARHVLGDIPADCHLHRAMGDARLLARLWVEMMRAG